MDLPHLLNARVLGRAASQWKSFSVIFSATSSLFQNFCISDIISKEIYLTAESASGPQLGPPHPTEVAITALQQVQAVSLKESYQMPF